MAALALGVQAHRAYRRAETNDDQVEVDVLVGEALLERLEAERQPAVVGALGVALGLTRHATLRLSRRDGCAKTCRSGNKRATSASASR